MRRAIAGKARNEGRGFVWYRSALMDADVLVIGGGPVGAALGMLLRRAGLRAVVVDRARFPRDKPCGEGLMPSGAAVLRDLGLDLAT